MTSKFDKIEISQLRDGNSASLIGSNLVSLTAEIMLYWARVSPSLPSSAKVPMQPRKSPFFYQVTKRGARI